MRLGFDKWWLLPFGVLVVSTLVAVGIIFFRPPEASEGAADCSGASTTDYACYQEYYRGLVRDSGVEAAFAELRDEHKENEFVRASCHQLTHVIGRAAAERYGDIPGAYVRGEHFCGTGYYHGVIEAIAARIGADKILEEADTLCAELRENQEHSAYHSGCAHGLGHGFMGILDNELFESLYACDALTDGWEREHCYNGVFMENLPDSDNRSHPSKYLKEDRPLYPCTVVEDRYKTQCYQKQTSYALGTQGYDFTKVFELCETVEDGFRPACYRGLGRNAFEQGTRENITEAAQTASADMLCALGEDHEARSNCIVGAVRYFLLYYGNDTRAKAFCESLEANLREACLGSSAEFYEDFDIA
jgi:hypothetical protein